ncbi:MAG: hypothetical protein P8M50_01505 [Paracoccaceae bacterium]|nr:hypothetical protein [Paracoccaceae bacterium]
MLIEDISTSQVLTAVLFIVVLIAVQIYIKKNKYTLKAKWASNQRIRLIDSTRLGPTEKVQIIKVDDCEYLYFFNKGNQPVIVPMIADKVISSTTLGKVDLRATLPPKNHSNSNKAKVKSRMGTIPKADHKIIQAISNARKQNPKVSFD